MKWIAARIIFEAPDNTLAADLIADLFADLGVTGVVIDDPLLMPGEDTDGWEQRPRLRPEYHAVTGYLADNPQGHDQMEKLSATLPRLAERAAIRCRIESRMLDEEDWAEAWKAFFWPEKVGYRVVIKPTWREYATEKDDIVVEIDPGMAFGTGTHATTALCIRMLERFLSPGDRLLDVGCGSGILMAVAAKLGCGPMTGIDRDQVAVDIAGANLVGNRVPASQYTLAAGNLIKGVEGPFELITANILSEVIITLLDTVQRVMMPGGLLVCSGIISAREDDVCKKLIAVGLEVVDIMRRDEWVAIASRQPRRISFSK